MKKISFGVKSSSIQQIVPAKNQIPEWFKQTPLYFDNAKSFSIAKSNLSFKGCSPFLDSFTSGYTALLWQSVEVVTKEDGNKDLIWPDSTYPVASLREHPGNSSLPVPHGHTDQHLTWAAPFTIKTPKGYSALITHPLNRFDLPFTTLSGIIDADSVIGPGNLPFFISKDFEGIIPAGTPIFQIIPFKREDWTHVIDEKTAEDGDKARLQSMTAIPGFYKKNKWVKKTFN